MRVLCTHPGKLGDLLWALPTVRAIAEATGAPVTLLVAKELGARLRDSAALLSQPYLRDVLVDATWETLDTAPRSPRTPPRAHPGDDVVVHLGYEGWPEPTLPREVYWRVSAELMRTHGLRLPPLNLGTPWISREGLGVRQGTVLRTLSIGFTDEHFELKVGITHLLPIAATVLAPAGSRWELEAMTPPTTLLQAAVRIADSRVVLADCSALHVLAVALGVPVVVMEPNPHRLHPTFWPVGQDGPQVTLVRGTDGQATFDARHTWEDLQQVLAEQVARS